MTSAMLVMFMVQGNNGEVCSNYVLLMWMLIRIMIMRRERMLTMMLALVMLS
jgi:hypothetical protein